MNYNDVPDDLLDEEYYDVGDSWQILITVVFAIIIVMACIV